MKRKEPSKELRAILLGIATLANKAEIERALHLLDYPALCQIQDLSGHAYVPGFALWLINNAFDLAKTGLASEQQSYLAELVPDAPISQPSLSIDKL